MAVIKPFKALCYNTKKAGDISELTCPPYDIISDEQRTKYLNKNQYNVIRLELPKGEDPYKDAAKALDSWRSAKVLETLDQDGIYIYEEEFSVKGEVKKLKGFISLVELSEFSKGIVLPHEETLSKAKTDRFNLMSETFCNFSQIYSLYFDQQAETSALLNELSAKEPNVCFTDAAEVTHRLWIVTDENAIATISKQFEDRKLYIADGHHRYETALNFRNHLKEQGVITSEDHKANYVMMMLVNMENDGLVVFPTHRIVKDIENFDADEVIEKCSKYFTITKVSIVAGKKPLKTVISEDLEDEYAKGHKAFALYDGEENTYFKLILNDDKIMAKLMPTASEACRNLDVSILHTLILERLFGIDKANMANQTNLIYTRDLSEALQAVDVGDANCSFIINPTKVSEIADVASAGEKMPQKSTYFYPKLITGLVINELK